MKKDIILKKGKFMTQWLLFMSIMTTMFTVSCKKKTTTTEQFTLTITKTGTGSVSASYAGGSATEAQLTAGVKIDKDVAVTLTATPDVATPNVVWNGTTTGNTLQVTMSQDQTISVAFSATPLVYHSISFTATPADAGTMQVYDMAGNLITDITKIVENTKVRISIIPAVGKALTAITGVDIAGTNTTLIMTADKSITASFGNIFKVAFNSNSGSAIADTLVIEGSYITKPANPTRSGFSFAGWYKDDVSFNNVWNFTTDKVTATTTLYALWKRPYAIGDYYPNATDATTAIGVVFWVDPTDATKGKMVSLNEGKGRWGTLGYSEYDNGVADIISEDDGAVATKNLIIARKGNSDFATAYYAFNWIYTIKNGSNVNGRWYLPAKNELKMLYAAMSGFRWIASGTAGAGEIKDWGDITADMPGYNVSTAITARNVFNGKLATAGGTVISVANYWSSTQSSKDLAWYISLPSGRTDGSGKHNDYFIRAISVFN